MRRPAVIKEQRHQRRPRRDHTVSKLACQAMPQISRANLWNRQTAGGHDQIARSQSACATFDFESVCFVVSAAPYLSDLARLQALHSRTFAFSKQHPDDAFRRVIAEQLPLMLFVIVDTVLSDQLNKALRRISTQGKAHEAGLLAEVAVFAPTLKIGEVASPPTRDPNFLGGAFCMVDEGYVKTTQPRLGRAHQPGGACADHDNVKAVLHGSKPV
jgi:hypothetical protein